MSQCACITFTNNGYRDFTLNQLKQLQLIDFQGKFIIYCCDQQSYDFFKQKHKYVKLLKQNEYSSSELQIWRTDKYCDLMHVKDHIIHQSLKLYKFVIYIDGDIIVKDKNLIKTVLSYMNRVDLAIQMDYFSQLHTSACAGFMCIRSTPQTLELFSPNGKKKQKYDDQMHLNNFLRTNRRFKFKLLPIKKFPNGRFWYEKRDIVDPNYHLVHYNCVLHDKKKDLMIKDNHWLLNNEDFDEDESQSKVQNEALTQTETDIEKQNNIENQTIHSSKSATTIDSGQEVEIH